MAQSPNRLQPDTPLGDNLSLINDNFDKAVQDISDIGARFTTTGSFHVTIAAGGILPPYSIATLDGTHRYQPGSVQVVPRFDVYEDNDLNSSYLVGFTNSQSSKAIVSSYVQKTPTAGSVANFCIAIQNTDVASHVYWVYIDASYQDSPRTGNFA